MQERTEEIAAATAQAQGQLSRREARILVEKAAVDMDQYVVRMRAELPLFDDVLRRGAEAAGKAALMTIDVASEDKKQVIDAKHGLIILRDALSGAHDSVAGFRDKVRGLPRMTTVLNKAKRETVEVLQQTLDSMDAGRKVVIEAIRALDSLIGEENV